MAFLLNSQVQGVSGKNVQSTQTPWRGAPEARGPMQLRQLHQLKASPTCESHFLQIRICTHQQWHAEGGVLQP